MWPTQPAVTQRVSRRHGGRRAASPSRVNQSRMKPIVRIVPLFAAASTAAARMRARRGVVSPWSSSITCRRTCTARGTPCARAAISAAITAARLVRPKARTMQPRTLSETSYPRPVGASPITRLQGYRVRALSVICVWLVCGGDPTRTPPSSTLAPTISN